MSAFFRRLLPGVEWLVMGGILTAVYLTGIGNVPFHPDESQWIATSHYLEKFVNGRFTSPVWQEIPWVLTQPPMARYVIGIGRLAGGYGGDELNAPWLFSRDRETNLSEGRMPEPGLLWWSRLPMAVTAVICGLLLIFMARVVSGRPAGWILLLLFILPLYYPVQLRRAMGEALLLLFILLAVLAGYGAVRSWGLLKHTEGRQGRMWVRPLAWLLLLACCAGLGGAVKLNGLALVGAGMLLALVLAWKGRRYPFAWGFAIAGLVLLPLLTMGVFTAVNPAMYAHPLQLTKSMLTFRADEIAIQQAASPQASLPLTDIHKRITTVPNSILVFATVRAAPPLLKIAMLTLTLAGLGLLIYQAYQWWVNDIAGDGRRQDMSLVLLLVMGIMVWLAFLTPLDWDRYYLPPVVLVSLGTAVSLSHILTQVGHRISS